VSGAASKALKIIISSSFFIFYKKPILRILLEIKGLIFLDHL